MDIHERAFQFLIDLPLVKAWEDMRTTLEGVSDKKPRDWMLPVIGCEAVGGSMEDAISAVSAVACMQISIILIDDMLDADPRGEYHRLGMPETANLAAAFQAASVEAITQSRAKPSVKVAAIESLVRMVQVVSLGQHLDIQNPADEEAYWRLVKAKSSPFFAAALEIGALLGGGSEAAVNAVKQFGQLYGEIIQIHDDLNDVMAVPTNPDWLRGRSPLPVLYAQLVDHPLRARFQELRQSISDPAALAEAQAILVSCGAVSYSIHQILLRHQAAHKLLEEMSLSSKEGLEKLLNAVVEPIQRLFSGIGVNHMENLAGSFDPFS